MESELQFQYAAGLNSFHLLGEKEKKIEHNFVEASHISVKHLLSKMKSSLWKYPFGCFSESTVQPQNKFDC